MLLCHSVTQLRGPRRDRAPFLTAAPRCLCACLATSMSLQLAAQMAVRAEGARLDLLLRSPGLGGTSRPDWLTPRSATSTGVRSGNVKTGEADWCARWHLRPAGLERWRRPKLLDRATPSPDSRAYQTTYRFAEHKPDRHHKLVRFKEYYAARPEPANGLATTWATCSIQSSAAYTARRGRRDAARSASPRRDVTRSGNPRQGDDHTRGR